ncbi:hypothetical protein Nans01_34230 [Nocardiopsis ansamitocini]|uniref:Uncharacterized protein n=1 Tax=Nocardiopsis ansamitocini TaxID=1670832 RepID=A0A9W6P8R6_9ACTN|nr:hypothetical protein Nans01_34230 [Nocardiopsis ansamitocini]
MFYRQFAVKLSLPDKTLQGVTELAETGNLRFGPLIQWAQSWADYFGQPVPWQASQNGKLVREGVARPASADRATVEGSSR